MLGVHAAVAVSIMIITWMIMSSIGITVARYMKMLLTDLTILRKEFWFQVKIIVYVHSIC